MKMGKINYYGFSVDDIGLDGYSTEKQLNDLLEFCEQNKIKATLFAVPLADGKRMDKRPAYVALLREAIKHGHEIGQHGLTHDRFEIGIPPAMVMNLPHEGPARKFLAENREKINASHTVANIRKTLRTGREILEDAIGCPIKGFRSPALQSCANMFIALEEENYQYDSSVCLQLAGWDLINGVDYIPREITQERFEQIKKSSMRRELPLTTEYTWYLGKDKFEKACALAMHDLHACLAAGVPFISICHVSPIFEGESGFGLDLYRRLFNGIRELNCGSAMEVRSLTLSEIADNVIVAG